MGKQIVVTKLIATFFSIALIFRTPIAYIKEIKGLPSKGAHSIITNVGTNNLHFYFYAHYVEAENSTAMYFLYSTIDGAYLYLQICSVY